MADYIAINKANWDERAPEHAVAPGYCFQRQISDPDYLSGVVRFDIPLLGNVTGLDIIHLQCHIATDTLSLARRGAKSVVGLDFSPASLKEARRLADNAAGGDKLSFVEASTYDALTVAKAASFDLVFTGIGAICWLPSIKQWAQTVAGLLKPGGRLFIREGHPMLWSIDETITTDLSIRFPYFERKEPMTFEDGTTYVKLQEEKSFASAKTVVWNHGLGEIVQALLDVGMQITGLVEHKSLPWDALPGQMTDEDENGEYALKENPDRLPLSYTLQAIKRTWDDKGRLHPRE